MAYSFLRFDGFYLPCVSNNVGNVFVPVEEVSDTEGGQGNYDLYADLQYGSLSSNDFSDVSDLDLQTIEENQEHIIYQLDVLNTNINNLQHDNAITVGLVFSFVVIFSVQLVYKLMSHVLGLGNM